MGLSQATANINAAGGVEATLVAGITNRSIRVTGIVVANAGVGGTVFRFRSGAAGENISGDLRLGSNITLPAPYAKQGWFETRQGAGLFFLSDTTNMTGYITYEVN